MILSSHQPDFFPYMGYFYKIYKSDTFVFSDDVQYSKSGRHNYNDIMTANGVRRITLPVHYSCSNINEIHISPDKKWADKLIKTLTQEYKKASHFEEVFTTLEALIKDVYNHEYLSDFNLNCLFAIIKELRMGGKTYVLSSAMNLAGAKDRRILDMCQKLHAEVYYSGVAAKAYHVDSDYEKIGTKIVYSNYQPVEYPQVYGCFTPNLSCIDYFMNCGFVIPEGWKNEQ